LPSELWDLDWLETISLGGVCAVGHLAFQQSEDGNWAPTDEPYQPNHLDGLVVLLVQLPRLRHLDCSGAVINDLNTLADLSALQQLGLADTQVSDIGPLAGFSALQHLDLSSTGVTDLGPLAGLSTLQHLDLSSTGVTDLGPLAGFSALQHLDLSSTGVTDLGPLAGLSTLQQLDLGYTQVTDLGPLAGLCALQQLDLAGTQVTDLGPLAGLCALQELYLWETLSLTGLPQAVAGLPRLERLVLSPQPGLEEIPGEVLSQSSGDDCLSRLRAHLADLAVGARPLRDLKVIVLGNGRVGKTQLCRRLRGEAFQADADSTHGISITSIEVNLPGDEAPAVLNLWNFGGQDIYHGTHALFMRTRAIFLLVWTPQSEQGDHRHGGMVFRNQPLPYWLEHIRHLGGAKSPVIVLQTRCDGGLGECPNLPADASFLTPLLADGRLFTRVAYSAKDESGRAGVMDALQRAVTQLRAVQGRPLIGRGRLAVWEHMRAWRDADAEEAEPGARRRRLLPYGEFADLCAQHGVTSPETFAEVLHHAGMVFYRPHLLAGQLILDQSWALDAAYAVFTREGAVYEILRRLGGRFTRSMLDLLLWRARGLSVDDQRSLIGLMQASGICFEHRRGDDPDGTEYVAPDLLPEGRTGPPEALAGELAARWDPIAGEPLTASMRYPFSLAVDWPHGTVAARAAWRRQRALLALRRVPLRRREPSQRHPRGGRRQG